MTGRKFFAFMALAVAMAQLSMQTPAQLLAQEPIQETTFVDVDDANPPFMFAKTGRASGVYPELLATVFAAMDAKVVIRPLPWRRALAEIDAGMAGVGGIYKNTERLKRFDYSDPMFVERINIYSRKSDTTRYAGLADLRGKRIGVIRGWSYGDEFDEARKAEVLTVEDVNSDTQNFAKLDVGRLDAVLAITEAAEPQLRQFSSIQLAGTLVENPTYLAFNKTAGKAGFIERFNATLARLKQSGVVKKVVADAIHRR